jgi:hypothetical protein
VNIDYHVEVDGHYYSVPYALVKQQIEARLNAQVVELFHKGKRVASHQRSPLRGRHSTVAAHMPKAHQHYAEWTPQRLILWAAKTGEATAQVVEAILTSRPHPQQASGRVWASCGWANAMAMSAWKPPATAPSASVRVRTRVWNRSSNTISTGSPCLGHPLPPP